MNKKMVFLTTITFIFSLSTLFADTVMVKFVMGNVKIKNAKTGEWVKAKIKMKIDDSSYVKTGNNGKIEFISKNGSIVRIGKNKTVQIKELLLTSAKDKKLYKKLHYLKSRLSKGKNSNYYGATAVAGVRGADVQKQTEQEAKKELYWEK